MANDARLELHSLPDDRNPLNAKGIDVDERKMNDDCSLTPSAVKVPELVARAGIRECWG